MDTQVILKQLKEERARLDAAIAAVEGLENGTTVLVERKAVGRPAGRPAKKAAAPNAGKRTMSEEARAKIAAAQKARWAKQKKK